MRAAEVAEAGTGHPPRTGQQHTAQAPPGLLTCSRVADDAAEGEPPPPPPAPQLQELEPV